MTRHQAENYADAIMIGLSHTEALMAAIAVDNGVFSKYMALIDGIFDHNPTPKEAEQLHRCAIEIAGGTNV